MDYKCLAGPSAGPPAGAVQDVGPGGYIDDDPNTSSSDESSDDPGVEDPTPTPLPPAADRGKDRGARGGRGRGGADAPAGRGGPAHRARVMGGAGARANIAAVDAAMAAELARNNVGGPGDVPANGDQPPDPFDKLSKLEYKHLARKIEQIEF